MLEIKDKIFYVYIYIDPRNNSPFYVGKGHENRAYSHLWEAKNTRKNNYKVNKIRKIIRETGQDPEIILFKTGLSEDEAFSLEKGLIKCWGRKDNGTGCLLNLTDGGEGSINMAEEIREKISKTLTGKYVGENSPSYGLIRTKETREKLSESKKGKQAGENNPFYGKHHTEEFKKQQSEKAIERFSNPENHPMYGKKMTDEQNKANSERQIGLQAGEKNGMYGKHHSEESKQKMSKAQKGMFAGEKNPMYGVHLTGEKNGMYGKHHTEETKEKMRRKRLAYLKNKN